MLFNIIFLLTLYIPFIEHSQKKKKKTKVIEVENRSEVARA